MYDLEWRHAKYTYQPYTEIEASLAGVEEENQANNKQASNAVRTIQSLTGLHQTTFNSDGSRKQKQAEQ